MALKFQRLFFTTRRIVSSLEIEKKAACGQIHFLSFPFKPEVRSSSEMFVITKCTNQVLFSLSYHVKIIKIHSTRFARATDVFQNF